MFHASRFISYHEKTFITRRTSAAIQSDPITSISFRAVSGQFFRLLFNAQTVYECHYPGMYWNTTSAKGADCNDYKYSTTNYCYTPDDDDNDPGIPECGGYTGIICK